MSFMHGAGSDMPLYLETSSCMMIREGTTFAYLAIIDL